MFRHSTIRPTHLQTILSNSPMRRLQKSIRELGFPHCGKMLASTFRDWVFLLGSKIQLWKLISVFSLKLWLKIGSQRFCSYLTWNFEIIPVMKFGDFLRFKIKSIYFDYNQYKNCFIFPFYAIKSNFKSIDAQSFENYRP